MLEGVEMSAAPMKKPSKSAAGAAEPIGPNTGEERLKALALQLRAYLQPAQMAQVFYHYITLDNETADRYRVETMAADTGKHKGVRTDVCGLCGRPLP
jgi:hypothetical protein